jgi:hypothetical protein
MKKKREKMRKIVIKIIWHNKIEQPKQNLPESITTYNCINN